MGVVYEQGVFAWYFYRLHAPFDLYVFKPIGYVFFAYPEMQAYGRGGKRVINAEPAGYADVCFKAETACKAELYPEVPGP